MTPPLLFGLLMALAYQHFGRHAHQFGVGAQLLGFPGKPQHPDQALIEQQGQIDARLHAFQAFGGLRIDFHHPSVGQHQLRALMAGVDTLGFAAAKDQPLAVHHVNVVRQDGHRAIHDVLRQIMIQFEHRVTILGNICSCAQPQRENAVRQHKDSNVWVTETHAATNVNLGSRKNIIKRDKRCHRAPPLR